MNLLSKAWGYLAAAGAFLIAIVGIFFAGRSAGKNAERLKSTQQARKTEQKANEALTKGLQHEEDAVTAARRRRYERLRDGEQSEAPPTSVDS